MVRPWVVHLVALYADVGREDGTLMPLVDGGVWDQPARLWLGLRMVRAEYGRLREQDRKKGARKGGH
jgi:hypothetical protein